MTKIKYNLKKGGKEELNMGDDWSKVPKRSGTRSFNWVDYNLCIAFKNDRWELEVSCWRNSKKGCFSFGLGEGGDRFFSCENWDNMPIRVMTNCRGKGSTRGDGSVEIKFNLTRRRRFPSGGGGLHLQFPSVRMGGETSVNINNNVNRGGWWWAIKK